MPSPTDHDDLGPAPEDVLLAVRAEGGRRRTRRHRRNTALVGLGLALVAVPTISLLPDGHRAGEVEVAGVQYERSTTTAVDIADGSATTALGAAVTIPPTTQAASAPTTAAPATSPTTAPRPTTPVTAAPTTAPPCRNSTEPSCGTFRWDPAPGSNAPLRASFAEGPTTAVVGQDVTFSVFWNDADARLVFDHFSADGTALTRSCTSTPRFGPWTTPFANGGAGTLTYHHTFTAPGTYPVVVSLGTDVTGGDCADPYASDAQVELTIVVTAEATPAP